MGIPDIRSYSYDLEKPIPVFGSDESIAGIKDIFAYIFDPSTYVGGGIPRLSCEIISSPFTLFNKKIMPIAVKHSTLDGCFGYRIDNVAYIPDVKAISNTQKAMLTNLDCLIIDCLRGTREHSTHIILPESIAIARELRPGKCYFTHMCHNVHYRLDSVHLDSWMEFAWDGLKVEV
jgi:phosphoribosyl 1,2-cyclic phosphate phosphodiesterase